MTHKVYVVTDLGPGDGGKGGVVHRVATMTSAHTIIKRGGAQGSHGVRTSKGEHFAFSQWGCGTLEGIPTHISGQMIVSPEGLLNEAEALRYQCGIYDPFSLLTVDETALCATPFHGIASRLKEMARGNNPRGTIGTGVGVAYREFRETPERSLVVGDLTRHDLRERLADNRTWIQASLRSLAESEFLAQDQAAVAEELRLLYSDGFFDYTFERFTQVAKLVKIVPHEFLGESILAKEGTAVIETSHGILTDRLYGFHPHTSAIRTLPCFTHDMLERTGYQGQIVDIGITRAYAIRHGAGPMPTTDPEIGDRLLPGSNKDENRFQGKVRVGPLDAVLLRYAIAASGGPTAFDGLAVTWFDQIQVNKSWPLALRYQGLLDDEFFDSHGDIRCAEPPNEEHQARLGDYLKAVQPDVSSIPIGEEVSREDLFSLCADTLKGQLDVPVRMISFGPTELDKLSK